MTVKKQGESGAQVTESERTPKEAFVYTAEDMPEREEEEKAPESLSRLDSRAIRNEEADPHPSLLHVPNRVIEVTIIKPGPAKVKVDEAQVSYSEEALRKSLPLWEGVACFCNHFNKSVRNIAGVYFSPWWDEGVKAKLRFIDDALYHLVEQIIGDREEGLPVPDIGISADIGIKGMPLDHTFEVEEITHILSADIVFSPAAGGSFDRVLNSIKERYGIPVAEGDSPRREPQNQSDADSSPRESAEELVPVKRVRDLQSANDKLRAQMKNQQELFSEKDKLITRLQSDLEVAVAKYREYLLAEHPEIPPELVQGDSIEEINDSFLKGQKVVEAVSQHLEENIPAGAPARSGFDLSAMSAREKIEYALRKATK